MNTDDQLARMQEWLDTHPAPRLPHDPTTNLDEQTLRTMHRGFSKGARREQRRPKPFVTDELGYTPTGTWVPGSGSAA